MSADAVWKKCGHPREGNTVGVSTEQPGGRCGTCHAKRHAAYAAKWYQANKGCERFKARKRASAAQWRTAHPDRRRAAEWRRAGMLNRAGQPFTWSNYRVLFENQSGLCLLCGRPAPQGRRLVPDHFHGPDGRGVVRALVCTPCNTIEGLMATHGINPSRYADAQARPRPTHRHP